MKTKLYTANTVPKSLPWSIGVLPALVTVFVFAGAAHVASASLIYPTNNGFEQPDLGSGAGAFMYNPVAPGWTFSEGSVGIAANGSAFNVTGATNGNNDNGATSTSGQAAFLKGAAGLSTRSTPGSRRR